MESKESIISVHVRVPTWKDVLVVKVSSDTSLFDFQKLLHQTFPKFVFPPDQQVLRCGKTTITPTHHGRFDSTKVPLVDLDVKDGTTLECLPGNTIKTFYFREPGTHAKVVTKSPPRLAKEEREIEFLKQQQVKIEERIAALCEDGNTAKAASLRTRPSPIPNRNKLCIRVNGKTFYTPFPQAQTEYVKIHMSERPKCQRVVTMRKGTEGVEYSAAVFHECPSIEQVFSGLFQDVHNEPLQELAEDALEDIYNRLVRYERKKKAIQKSQNKPHIPPFRKKTEHWDPQLHLQTSLRRLLLKPVELPKDALHEIIGDKLEDEGGELVTKIYSLLMEQPHDMTPEEESSVRTVMKGADITWPTLMQQQVHRTGCRQKKLPNMRVWCKFCCDGSSEEERIPTPPSLPDLVSPNDYFLPDV